MILLEENTAIEYTLKINGKDNYTICMTMEQLEGSTPCFVEQIREAIGVDDNDTIEIVKRKVISEC